MRSAASFSPASLLSLGQFCREVWYVRHRQEFSVKLWTFRYCLYFLTSSISSTWSIWIKYKFKIMTIFESFLEVRIKACSCVLQQSELLNEMMQEFCSFVENWTLAFLLVIFCSYILMSSYEGLIIGGCLVTFQWHLLADSHLITTHKYTKLSPGFNFKGSFHSP